VRAFDAGNTHFAEGAYQNALQSYQQAIDAGYVSGALYYNMGNAYFRLDQLGQAIRYYEKARRLIPEHPELQHNLEVAHSQIAIPVSSLPTPVWETWWDRFVLRMGAFPFFIAGLLFYALAAALIGHRIWSGTRNAWLRRTLSVSVILGLLLLAIAFAASLNPMLDQRAVVIANTTTLHESPETNAASEQDVPEGVLLDVLQQQETWLEVRLPNGVTGWIEAASAAEV
jgi:tetratricopeptide (TPR) repeat protein